MIRDRVCLFCGSFLAMICAVVMVFAGSRLLFVTSALAEVPAGLGNDLNVARIAAIGLGLGLALLMVALLMAHRVRPISHTGKLGIIGAGLLVLLSGALLFAAAHGAASDLAEADEMGHLVAHHSELASDVETVIHAHSGSVTSAFGMLFGATLVLSLSLWSLFWSQAPEDRPDRLARPAALCGVAGALLWASLLAAATFTGASAIAVGPAGGSPAFEAALYDVRLTLVLARGAAIGLAVYGLSLAILGARFHAEHNVGEPAGEW
jgi:hypothetical protein